MMLRGAGVSRLFLRGRRAVYSAATTAWQQRELSSSSPARASVKNVVVIGSGLMGAGIAQVTCMCFQCDALCLFNRARLCVDCKL